MWLPYAAKGRQVDRLEVGPLAGPQLVGLVEKVLLVHMDDLALGAHHQHRVVVARRAVRCIPRGQQACGTGAELEVRPCGADLTSALPWTT